MALQNPSLGIALTFPDRRGHPSLQDEELDAIKTRTSTAGHGPTDDFFMPIECRKASRPKRGGIRRRQAVKLNSSFKRSAGCAKDVLLISRKMHIFLLLLISLAIQTGLFAGPVLRSAKEKTSSPNDGPGIWETQQLLLEWELSTPGEDHKPRVVYVSAHRNLNPKLGEDFHYWSANVLHGTPGGNLKLDPKGWFSTPRLSRNEFVEIIRGSETELQKRDQTFQFKYVYVDFRTVSEHETEIAPQLRTIFASTKGEVELKPRGIISGFFMVFFNSKAIQLTVSALRERGLDFDPGRMAGDYHIPVDPTRAATWKAASELPDFGLVSPPRIVLIRKEGDPTKGAGRQDKR